MTSRLLTDAPLPDYNDYEAYNAALQNARSELVWLDPATMQREKICETERLDGSTIYVKYTTTASMCRITPRNAASTAPATA